MGRGAFLFGAREGANDCGDKHSETAWEGGQGELNGNIWGKGGGRCGRETIIYNTLWCRREMTRREEMAGIPLAAPCLPSPTAGDKGDNMWRN